MTKIFGHRGAAGTHPENTMISFKEVERIGADGIELDVQRSKDGFLVVIHDEKVNRTTNGKGYIKNLTLSEIKKLDAGYKFKKKYGVCKIPTLEEVFLWAKTNKLLINVELKNNVFEYRNMEEETINLIREHQLVNRVIISSFNHDSIAKCHRLAPEIEGAVLFSERMYKPWEYSKFVGAQAIHPKHVVVTEEVVRQSNANGIAVRPYTVNDEKLMKKFFAYNCDGLITDYPEKALDVLN